MPVTVGALFTLRRAVAVVAELQLFVNTALYRFPFCEARTEATDRVVEVAPLTLLKVAPPSVLICHCTVGAGVPLAAAVNVAVLPAQTV